MRIPGNQIPAALKALRRLLEKQEGILIAPIPGRFAERLDYTELTAGGNTGLPHGVRPKVFFREFPAWIQALERYLVNKWAGYKAVEGLGGLTSSTFYHRLQALGLKAPATKPDYVIEERRQRFRELYWQAVRMIGLNPRFNLTVYSFQPEDGKTWIVKGACTQCLAYGRIQLLYAVMVPESVEKLTYCPQCGTTIYAPGRSMTWTPDELRIGG